MYLVSYIKYDEYIEEYLDFNNKFDIQRYNHLKVLLKKNIIFDLLIRKVVI